MRIQAVQTLLTEEEIQALLKKSKCGNKKDAIRKAVEHYLKCKHTEVKNED